MSIKANIGFDHSIFPDGGHYIKLHKEEEGRLNNCDFPVYITWVYHGDVEVIKLLMLVNAIRNINKNLKIHLNCPYFPGARQDRICENGESFNLKVYADLINSLNFESVTVFDAHSDVTGALVNNVLIVDNSNFVEKSIFTNLMNNGLHPSYWIYNQKITLISPDAGANKKIFKLVKKLPIRNIEIIRADKERNTVTHEITGTVVYGDVKDKICFINDDICGKGGSFKPLAKRLKQMGATKVILIVSHYEGTANERELKESGIDKIYTHNHLGNYDPNGEKFVEVIS